MHLNKKREGLLILLLADSSPAEVAWGKVAFPSMPGGPCQFESPSVNQLSLQQILKETFLFIEDQNFQVKLYIYEIVT